MRQGLRDAARAEELALPPEVRGWLTEEEAREHVGPLVEVRGLADTEPRYLPAGPTLPPSGVVKEAHLDRMVFTAVLMKADNHGRCTYRLADGSVRSVGPGGKGALRTLLSRELEATTRGDLDE